MNLSLTDSRVYTLNYEETLNDSAIFRPWHSGSVPELPANAWKSGRYIRRALGPGSGDVICLEAGNWAPALFQLSSEVGTF